MPPSCPIPRDHGALLTLRPLVVACLVFAVSAPAAAATIDLDLATIGDSPLARNLIAPFGLPDEASQAAVAGSIDRVMVTWDKRKAPLLARYRGLDAGALVAAAVEAGGEAVVGAVGSAVRLGGDHHKLCIFETNDRDLVLTTAERFVGLEAIPPWPRANPNLVIQGIADNDDVKLGSMKERIHALYLEWNRHTDRVALTAHTASQDDARAVRRYITRRRPWVHLASGVGFESLDYASRLLDDAEIVVDRRTKVLLTQHLDEQMRTETVAQLAKLVDKQMKKMLD